jgi:hypothetical protein
MPTELRATITNGWSGPTPKWYSWCVDNWGCAYEPAIESIGRPSPNELQLSFETRYAPPLAALTHGAKLHAFEYRLVYCDASNLFRNRLKNLNSVSMYTQETKVFPKN